MTDYEQAIEWHEPHCQACGRLTASLLARAQKAEHELAHLRTGKVIGPG